jgi:FKBP-type peptidyl-prolyl cis-trans isomerase FklB
MQQAAEPNKREGQKFLDENKKKEGVVVLPSGLQYQVLHSGNGPSPKATDKVKCNYIGMLTNGTEFDNSYKRGEPSVFPVTGIIKGWSEAMQLMKVGDKWRIVIPSDLAYGDQGAGNAIPPGSTLVFEVELLSIEK